HSAVCNRRHPEGPRAAFRLRNLDHPHGRELIALLAQRFLQCLYHLLCIPCVDNPLDRHAIATRCPLVGLALPPSFPEDIRSPDLVIQTIKPSLLLLLGCAVEGSLQFPDVVNSVSSREAIGHPTLLRAPRTEAGLLPSRRVSRAIQTVL